MLIKKKNKTNLTRLRATVELMQKRNQILQTEERSIRFHNVIMKWDIDYHHD